MVIPVDISWTAGFLSGPQNVQPAGCTKIMKIMAIANTTGGNTGDAENLTFRGAARFGDCRHWRGSAAETSAYGPYGGAKELSVAASPAYAISCRIPDPRSAKPIAEIAGTLAETLANSGRSIDRADNLPRVHDVVRVERLLDRAHQRHRLAVLLVQELDLA